MLSQRFKDDFLELINSDYTALDFILFLKDNDVAQKIISEYCDIDQAVRFIGSHDESEIKKVLDIPHHEFYDPDFGSMDPLTGFRVRNKKNIENFEEYLQEGDDPLLWIKRAIDDEDDKDDAQPEKTSVFLKGFQYILDFQAGIPNVCNMRIGNTIDDWWPDALQDKNTGDEDIDLNLHKYDAFVEPILGDYYTVEKIIISMPLSDWSYEDIQKLYFYISQAFRYEDRNASYSYDTNNDLSEININLSNTLYNISIFNEETLGHAYLKIIIQRQNDNIPLYQALNTLVSLEKPDLRVCETVQEIISKYLSKVYHKND